MSADTSPEEFERLARAHCASLLETARTAFQPSEGIEALIIVAFTRGAAWGLEIDMSAFTAPHSEAHQ